MLKNLSSDVDLALEFTNTVIWRGREDRTDFWKGPQDLADWLIRLKLLPEEATLDDLQLDRAVTFREALFGVLLAVCKSGSPPPADVAKVQEEVVRALGRVQLEQHEAAFKLQLPQDGSFETAVNTIAVSAAELLTSVEQGRLRVCANDECGWVFVDSSKNRSRRWCSMAYCGNTAKAKRHYEKKKGSKDGDGAKG